MKRNQLNSIILQYLYFIDIAAEANIYQIYKKATEVQSHQTNNIRRQVKNEQHSHARITILVILISFLNVIGNVPFSICSLLINFIDMSSQIWYMTLVFMYTIKADLYFYFISLITNIKVFWTVTLKAFGESLLNLPFFLSQIIK